MKSWVAGCLLAFMGVTVPRLAEAVALAADSRQVARTEVRVIRARARAGQASEARLRDRELALATATARSSFGEPLANILAQLSDRAAAAGMERTSLSVIAATPIEPQAVPRIEERSVLISATASLGSLREFVEDLGRQPIAVRLESTRWEVLPPGAAGPAATGRVRLGLVALIPSGANP